MNPKPSQKRIRARKDASDSGSATETGSLSTESDNTPQRSQSKEVFDQRDGKRVRSEEVHCYSPQRPPQDRDTLTSSLV